MVACHKMIALVRDIVYLEIIAHLVQFRMDACLLCRVDRGVGNIAYLHLVGNVWRSSWVAVVKGVEGIDKSHHCHDKDIGKGGYGTNLFHFSSSNHESRS